MKARDLADLLLLAALWGASFMFMRAAAPAFGPIALVEVRVVIAAICLLLLLAVRGQLHTLAPARGRLLALGVLNSALPFALLTYATLAMTAGMAAILNAVTPMWTALIGWAWLKQPARPLQWLGLGLGLAGVAVLVWGRSGLSVTGAPLPLAPAIVAALVATASYGVAANFARSRLADLPSMTTAAGSQVGAALTLLLPAIVAWPAVTPPAGAWLAAVVLGVACTALAYLLYFRLIVRVGAMRAASVTFLIPLFATFWGALFLGEALTLQMLAGGAVILAGTALALGVPLRRPRAAAP